MESITDLGKVDRIAGICAVLGTDIVAFSTLPDEDQLTAVRLLSKWTRAALDYHEVSKEDYRWSPAGDGGYLTFRTPNASEKALDIGFSILEKAQRPTWTPRNGKQIELRFGLHAGPVYESDELAGGTNIWGDGINMAARVLSVACHSQVLVSSQYYDTYVRNKKEKDFEFGEPFARTVKHGVRVFVRNCCRRDLGLCKSEEVACRWTPIGTAWKITIENYLHLIDDAIECDEPIAALAATKFLIELNDNSKETNDKTNEVFAIIGEGSSYHDRGALRHSMFNHIPPNMLRKLVEEATPRLIPKETILCHEGDEGNSCFFPVYGTLLIESQNMPSIEIPPGQIVGEFSLWIPNSRRTAKISAKHDSLVLEVSQALFAKLCAQSRDMADNIHTLIKRRLLENLVNSNQFFPGLGKLDMEFLKSRPSMVAKYTAGTRLDLREKAYVIFHGKVLLSPAMLGEGGEYTIADCGSFSKESVIGIKTQVESCIDGEFAEVVEECVAIGLDHEALLDLFQKYEAVQEAWDAIWGRRYNNIMRRVGLSKKIA